MTEDIDEWRLFSVFCCSNCAANKGEMFTYPRTDICTHCVAKKRERHERDASRLKWRCDFCSIRYSVEHMITPTLCRGCDEARPRGRPSTLN